MDLLQTQTHAQTQPAWRGHNSVSLAQPTV